MSSSNGSKSRRVKFDSFANSTAGTTTTSAASAASSRSRPGPEQMKSSGHVKLMASDLPSEARHFLGEEPAIMMPVPLNWSNQPDGNSGSQKYLQDMGATIPEFLKRDLDMDFASCSGQPSGIPCRFCGMEFGPAALMNHQAKCKRETEAASVDGTRGTEPGYLIRNWYSRSHPLKRLERNKHMKECRYCRSSVPWSSLAQHEDECRSLLYGTTPTSGYY